MESTPLDAMEEVCIKHEDNICVKESTEALDEVRVKVEPVQYISVKTPYDSVRVKEEPEEHPSAEDIVKHEPTCLKRHGVNAVDTSELYADHIVKDELVLGPEIMERPMEDSQDEIEMNIKKEEMEEYTEEEDAN
ncbi:uncharacterized protein LOC134670297 [Cydia fagiglandana]|uniref:uncharacterized protein LOC134670297 n=1 Tax=Cydia fagiglandana TaxID=1458189 RepID=UPI002FEE06DB